MVLRRALTRWQLFAIPVLPLWLLVGFGVFGSGGGFFLTFLGSGVLFVLLAVLAGLTRARPFVREHGAMNRADAAATVAFHLAVVGLGFFGPGAIWFGLAAVLLGLATFWLTALELVREWRERVSGAVARASGRAPRAGAGSGENPDHTAPRTPKRMQGPGFDDGDVIIVHENGQ